VGKSTCGSGATGNSRNAITPLSASPIVSRVVATGRSMNGAEMFIWTNGEGLPPFDKGGLGGISLRPHENQIPLDPRFSKGEEAFHLERRNASRGVEGSGNEPDRTRYPSPAPARGEGTLLRPKRCARRSNAR